MTKIELSVLFKKLQRDDKKEIMEFHVMGENLEHSENLVMMAGNMALLNVVGSEAGQIPVEFKSIQRDSKKTVFKFEVKGDSQDKIIQLYPYAGNNVTINLEESQMSLEELEEGSTHEGIGYDVNQDGTVASVDQVSFDDVEELDDTEYPFEPSPDELQE